MYHGIKFSAAGKCVEIPAQHRIPPAVNVCTFPVIEQDRWVWVWMGDAALADTSRIPRALGHEDPEYLIGTGELAYDANYQLIHDNLLDLTHLSFVHEKTLGRGSLVWGAAQPIFLPLERDVRVQRWLRNHTVAHYMTAAEGARGDHWVQPAFGGGVPETS
jgi:vanillate O-demethylase monooxygenase subunit